MAARRVANGDGPHGVERLVEPAEVVDASRDVIEGSRPAAAAANAEAPVFEIPYGPAAPGQILHEPVLQPKSIPRSPEAAMDQDRDRPGPSAVWRSQLPELVPVLAVGVLSSDDRSSIAAAVAAIEASLSSGAGTARSAARTPGGAGAGTRGRRRGR